MSNLNRRQVLKAIGLTAAAAVLSEAGTVAAAPIAPKAGNGFVYSLNMSTIRGHNLGFIKELEIAAKAGFTSVEIWIDTLQTYLQSGGSLTEAKKIIDGLGLKVEDAIGFAAWLADDEPTRKKALEQLQQEMEMLARIDCHRIAAPPAGMTKGPVLDLDVVTERYLAILKMGEQTGVMPQLEMWGGSQNLKHISQVLYVATQCDNPNARVLLDVFHIFKGQSAAESLKYVGHHALDIFHVNDYPAGISPGQISEPDRVYCGDGIAPLKQILQIVKNPERPLVISFEVFNKSYYAQDALTVAKTALAKMKAVAR
ncbi:sugar phosphate isomerase/epimerase family protein [Mucilaginibacter sp. cycad4]|uniref:sugar phosphate isomerase/epimerase family protein n=1 Tax=Mucilaginibacter sp. cycad4 TaxID=3342096 RepID=UPI002AAB6EF8|nr:sugar phosphate isomerase/epimerase family protein [Mucilaginibacter gossypii]WPV02874.1 sugar phosphate isomerase/epimerase family protein [Mucilaginibacter gossypii]